MDRVRLQFGQFGVGGDYGSNFTNAGTAPAHSEPQANTFQQHANNFASTIYGSQPSHHAAQTGKLSRTRSTVRPDPSFAGDGSTWQMLVCESAELPSGACCQHQCMRATAVCSCRCLHEARFIVLHCGAGQQQQPQQQGDQLGSSLQAGQGASDPFKSGDLSSTGQQQVCGSSSTRCLSIFRSWSKRCLIKAYETVLPQPPLYHACRRRRTTTRRRRSRASSSPAASSSRARCSSSSRRASSSGPT